MATRCPITRSQFAKAASENKIVLVIDGKEFPIRPKAVDGDRAEDSLGFGINIRDDESVVIDGVKCPCMIQVNVTCIGSKLK